MNLQLKERTQLRNRRLIPGALVATETGPDYFSSEQHYAFLARRIVASLRGGGRLLLISGDPPADPQALSEALRDVAGGDLDIVIISCGPELTREDLERTVRIVTRPTAASGAAMTSESLMAAPPVLLYNGFDQLSDKQIEEVYSTLTCDQAAIAGVLLAPRDFLLRLERPALHFLKEHLGAHFGFQDIGDDETITFLHNQLLAQRDRGTAARSFRRGILIGIAGSVVALAVSIGLFAILNRATEQVHVARESTDERMAVSEVGTRLTPAAERATNLDSPYASSQAETSPAFATTPPHPPSPTVTASPLPVAQPTTADPLVTNFTRADTAPKTDPKSAAATTPLEPLSFTGAKSPSPAAQSAIKHADGLHSSDGEIATLLARGDAFLNSGDITSARLFYERAADAGSGLAALRLGGTFDPVIFGQVRTFRVIADPAQALSWYRRARDLGMIEADQRIKRLEPAHTGAQDNPSH